MDLNLIDEKTITGSSYSYNVVISPNDLYIAISDFVSGVYIYDSETLDLIKHLTVEDPDFNDYSYPIVFSNDSSIFSCVFYNEAYDKQILYTYNTSDWTTKNIVERSEAPGYKIRIDKNDNLLALSQSGQIIIIDLNSLSIIKTITDLDSYNEFDFNPIKNEFTCGRTNNDSFLVYNTETWEIKNEVFDGYNDTLFYIEYSNDGSMLLDTFGNKIIVYDTSDWSKINEIDLSERQSWTTRFDKNDNYISTPIYETEKCLIHNTSDWSLETTITDLSNVSSSNFFNESNKFVLLNDSGNFNLYEYDSYDFYENYQTYTILNEKKYDFKQTLRELYENSIVNKQTKLNLISSAPYRQYKITPREPSGLVILYKDEIRAVGMKIESEVTSFVLSKGGCYVYDEDQELIDEPECFIYEDEVFTYIDTAEYEVGKQYDIKFVVEVDSKDIIGKMKIKVEE